MQPGKFNVLIDQAFGSSGKGKSSTYLADKFGVVNTSSANYPNAGHYARFEDGVVFLAKAIPTSAILKKTKGFGMQCFISPGSGFSIPQLIAEWKESGKPNIFIHAQASIITEDHKKRESEGSDSTIHIASTMQGTAAALVDKILRKPNVLLAHSGIQQFLGHPTAVEFFGGNDPSLIEFLEKVQVIPGQEFRNLTHSKIKNGQTWLHEGSQGYALSIDHGFFPFTTSRNCTVQAAMDYMAVPAQMLGDVYLNLRSYPIRVGNIVQNGIQKGFSGDFYPDSRETTWEEVALNSGMPQEEIPKLIKTEHTSVTKRLRRVSTFSFDGLRDAVQTNGATKLILNFIQYIDWKDAGLKGGKEAYEKLSSKSRAFISKIEEEVNIPVVLIGTGAMHDEMISLL